MSDGARPSESSGNLNESQNTNQANKKVFLNANDMSEDEIVAALMDVWSEQAPNG